MAESALRSAGGTLFAGDFIVASATKGRLDVCVVDVSGKGDAAATRALLLSGAFGGLITAVPPHEFLTAANAYLLGHRWDEGFATAVQLSLDLTSGHFEVWTAGHPPCVHLAAGSGRWSALQSDGPVLGLIEGAEFESVRGVMRPGDALLLYTDGLVETAKREIELGIDRLIGEAEKALHGAPARPGRPAGGPARLEGRRPRAAAGAPAPLRHPGALRSASGPLAVGVARCSCGTMSGLRGCSSMVEPQSSKLATRVRFPSSALRRLPDACVRGPSGGA